MGWNGWFRIADAYDIIQFVTILDHSMNQLIFMAIYLFMISIHAYSFFPTLEIWLYQFLIIAYLFILHCIYDLLRSLY